MSNIRFSQDWNGKLKSDKYFTTIRLQKPYYKKGKEFGIVCKNVEIGTAKIQNVYPVRMDKLSDYICFLDTGYNKTETQEIFKKMYPNTDWNKQQLVVIMLKWIEKNTN